MGLYFGVKHANLVAYLTTPQAKNAPRLTVGDLRDFFLYLSDGYTWKDHPPLISSVKGWIESVQKAADDGTARLSRLPARQEGAFVGPEELDNIVEGLRPLLSKYSLFGLAAGNVDENKKLDELSSKIAKESKGNALVLIPRFERNSLHEMRPQTLFDTLDPFPGISRIAREPALWPGFVFWSHSGATATCPLADLSELYGSLEGPLMDGKLEVIDRILKSYAPKVASKKILHLSDLHFGSRYASENHALLSAHLESVVPGVDRVVITGDLFDNAKEADADQFAVFRGELLRMTKDHRKPISIPGNHDERWMGNKLGAFGERLRQLAELEWSRVVADDDLKCIFFCFDSASEGNWARGHVSKRELRTVAMLFEQECGARAERRDYLTLAMVHHHPFSFQTANITFIEKALALIGLNDDAFLGMDDPEEFITWCARRGVSAILHGHKHVAHDAVRKVTVEHRNRTVERELRAIGCGSSLGMDGGKLSYDLLSWDDRSKKWSVSFVADPGDFSGFVSEYVSLSTV